MKIKIKHFDKYIGLILYVVAKHSKTPILDHWDLIQHGILGLAKALKTYDKNKCPEKYWVYRIINSEIIKARYKNNKERKEDSGNEKLLDKLQADIKNPLENLIQQEETSIKKRQYDLLIKRLKIITKHDPLLREIYLRNILNDERISQLALLYKLDYLKLREKINRITRELQKYFIQKNIYIKGD